MVGSGGLVSGGLGVEGVKWYGWGGGAQRVGRMGIKGSGVKEGRGGKNGGQGVGGQRWWRSSLCR